MANAPSPLQPTWRGHIRTTMDALILFEACLEGRLSHVPRRPHDREREELIKSGNVFIYEEHSSGIKRWTDGYNWSPSRILGNFLIYRELEKAFPPGEKKKAIKKKNKPAGIAKPSDNHRSSSANLGAAVTSVLNNHSASDGQMDSERALIGSLVDSYPFKEEGLVKKTISVHWQGVPHHLVSYYKVEDVKSNLLGPPCRDPRLMNIVPRSGLISAQNFRVPVDQDEFAVDSNDVRAWSLFPGHISNGHLGNPDMSGLMPYAPRSLSVPNTNMSMGYTTHYAIPTHHAMQHANMQHTLSSNVANGHYSTTHLQPGSYGGGGFDPVRNSQAGRHSIAGSGGMPGGLAADYSKLTLDNTRRASISTYDTPLPATTVELSGLPATTMTSSEPRSNFFPHALISESDYYSARPPVTTASSDTLKYETTRSSASLLTPGISQSLGVEQEERGSWQAGGYQDYAPQAHTTYNMGGSPNNWSTEAIPAVSR
jgi:hypothetical protein